MKYFWSDKLFLNMLILFIINKKSSNIEPLIINYPIIIIPKVPINESITPNKFNLLIFFLVR